GITYDQLVVSGNVTVGGALSPVSTNAGSIPNGSTFTVIRNDGAAAVTNTFAGLPQLALLTNGPLVWRVNYLGGNGNDVDLTLISGGASNTPPVLAAVSNRTLIAGQWLLITNTATDSDLPAQTLTFSLTVFPTGAVVNASNGVLSWRPALAQAPSTNPFTVRVTDNGTPNLSATTNFLVTVLPVATPIVTTAIVQTNRFRLTVAGDTGPDYTVQATTNIPGWTNTSNFQRRFYHVVPGP
ncbi:MAG: cadherin repeat domain-containing protein, partial [Verrucomicrobia bacterium]|nr:cadherin repeat domain-containing protein [Verrucomicrobiota bacterium]